MANLHVPTSSLLAVPQAAPSRRQLLVGATAAAAVGLTAQRASASPAAAAPVLLGAGSGSGVAKDRVHRWAEDTWHSLVAMTDAKRPMARARQSKNMWIAANEEEQGSVRRS